MTVPRDDTPVAHLLSHHSECSDPKAWVIHANDEFDFGREEVERVYGINEPTISSHHLKFRCVVYEDDGEQAVSPMVYVRILSSNVAQLIRTGLDRDGIGHAVSKRDPDVLLNDGDILQLTPDISLSFHAEEYYAAKSDGLDTIQTAELERFSNQFVVSDRRLGVGGNASVFVAVKQSSRRQVACKIVGLPFTQSTATERIQSDLRSTPQDRHAELKTIEQRLTASRESLAREYNVLKGLNHPNIITLEKVICSTYNIYIFSQLITGGDLSSYLDQRGALTEAQAAVIVRQLLKAVEYLHKNGVVHRDIKPENILMTSWRDGARIVLTDFGQARTIEGAKTATKRAAVFRMQTLVGTYGYTAPEVFKQMKRSLEGKGYSKAIDIWSIGCVTATLLTSDLIFDDQGEENAATHPDDGAQGDPDRWNLSIMDAGGPWNSVGRKAKSFIRGCLVVDGGERLTAKQALLHPWFTNKHYAAEIEAAYERAIQDWEPRERASNLIEFIDTADVVPAVSGPEYMKFFDEETKSRHFQDLPPGTIKTSARVPRQKHVRTPLPTISEDAERSYVEVPASPPTAPQESMFTTSIFPYIAKQPLTQISSETIGRLSIEDFAPPQTQFTFVPPQTYLNYPQRGAATQSQYNDGVTQSQSILNKTSPPKLTLNETLGDFRRDRPTNVPTDNEHAYSRKRVCR